MRHYELTESARMWDNIIANLKQSPSITDPRRQFRNDPGGYHRSSRQIFHTWAKQRMKGYRAGILRSNVPTSRICFLAFIGLMQRECGIPVTGIFDTATVRAFAQNQDKFTDPYISSRVKQYLDPKIPREYYEVVKKIENQSTGGAQWSSAYATYWNYTGNQDFGIGPGQVEPETYNKDVKKYGHAKSNFDFANFEHVTSIERLTKLMNDAINRKMEIAEAKGGSLEAFAKAWNPDHWDKATAVLRNKGDDNKTVSVPKPKPRPDQVGNKEPDDIEDFKTNKQVAKAPSKGLVSRIGKVLQGYFQ